jgi:hypothetical protein
MDKRDAAFQACVRLGINRYARRLRIVSPLVFRYDPVLLALIQETIKSASAVYKRDAGEVFERGLRDESSLWKPEKYRGLPPPDADSEVV